MDMNLKYEKEVKKELITFFKERNYNGVYASELVSYLECNLHTSIWDEIFEDLFNEDPVRLIPFITLLLENKLVDVMAEGVQPLKIYLNKKWVRGEKINKL